MEPEKLKEIVDDLLTCEEQADNVFRFASACDLENMVFSLRLIEDKYDDITDKLQALAEAEKGLSAFEAISALDRFVSSKRRKMYEKLKTILEEKCGCRLKEIWK